MTTDVREILAMNDPEDIRNILWNLAQQQQVNEQAYIEIDTVEELSPDLGEEVVQSTGSTGGATVVKVVDTQFDKTADDTLEDVPGLSIDLVSGKTYTFEAHLFIDMGNNIGGRKLALSGTATYSMLNIGSWAEVLPVHDLDTEILSASGGGYIYDQIYGIITASSDGTLTVQFAQDNTYPTTSTSSVLVGSSFTVREIVA